MKLSPLVLAKKILLDLKLSDEHYLNMYCHVVSASTQGAAILTFKPDICLCINYIEEHAFLVRKHTQFICYYKIDIMSFNKILNEYRLFQTSLLDD